MACDSASLGTGEGSHFSGRPPPPYHLFDVLKEFSTTNLITNAGQPHIVINCQMSQVMPPDTRIDERSNNLNVDLELLPPQVGNHNQLDVGDLAEREVIHLASRPVAQKPTASELSSSEGGCPLPLSSASGSHHLREKQIGYSDPYISRPRPPVYPRSPSLRRAYGVPEHLNRKQTVSQLSISSRLQPCHEQVGYGDSYFSGLRSPAIAESPLRKAHDAPESSRLFNPRPINTVHNVNAARSASTYVASGHTRHESVFYGRSQSSHLSHRKYADHCRLQERIRNRKKPVSANSEHLPGLTDRWSGIGQALVTEAVEDLDNNIVLPQTDPLVPVQKEKDFSCHFWPPCEEDFSTEVDLSDHIILTHGHKLHCPYEGWFRLGVKPFARKGSLTAHLVDEHDLQANRLRRITRALLKDE